MIFVFINKWCQICLFRWLTFFFAMSLLVVMFFNGVTKPSNSFLKRCKWLNWATYFLAFTLSLFHMLSNIHKYINSNNSKILLKLTHPTIVVLKWWPNIDDWNLPHLRHSIILRHSIHVFPENKCDVIYKRNSTLFFSSLRVEFDSCFKIDHGPFKVTGLITSPPPTLR